MVDRLHHLVGEVPPEGLPLAVDVDVVAAGEVDPLEGAGGPRERRGEGLLGDRAAALDDDRMAGLDLLHVGDSEVEDGHQRGALRREGDDLLVLEPEAGPDPGGVAGDEGVAVADQAAEGVAAVPLLGRAREDAGEVELGLGKGKEKSDQRQDLKAKVEKRESDREVSRFNKRGSEK